MSAYRKTEIANAFGRWLERYSPPAQIRDNQRAQQDEVESLIGVVLRFAPASDYLPWLAAVLDQVEYQMKTRAWPTKAEIGAACSNKRKTDAQMRPQVAEVKGPIQIIAEKIRRKEPIGDSWLYGRCALDLLASGEVRESDLDEYRKAHFFALRDFYGEDKARAMERDLRLRHADAKSTGPTRSYQPKVPNKRADTRDSYMEMSA